MSSPARLSEVLGRGLARLRIQRGLDAETLASHCRYRGLAWSGATVRAVEAGRRSLTLEELLFVTHLLGAAPADLLEGASDHIALTSYMAISPEVAARRLRGERPADEDVLLPRSDVLAKVLLAEERSAAEAETSAGQIVTAFVETDHEAVRKAARSLSITPEVLSLEAQKLWRRGFVDEREARIDAQGRPVEPRSLQARRGHVTRALIHEIAGSMQSRREGEMP